MVTYKQLFNGLMNNFFSLKNKPLGLLAFVAGISLLFNLTFPGASLLNILLGLIPFYILISLIVSTGERFTPKQSIMYIVIANVVNIILLTGFALISTLTTLLDSLGLAGMISAGLIVGSITDVIAIKILFKRLSLIDSLKIVSISTVSTTLVLLINLYEKL